MAKLRWWGPRASSADLVGRSACLGLQLPPIFFWQAVLGLLLSECWGLPCLDCVWVGSWATLGPFEPESSL